MSLVRREYENLGLSAEVIDIIMASWRPDSQKQYASYLKRWISFCNERKADVSNPAITDALEFLSSLYYQSNLGYSAINTARSALSIIFPVSDGCTFGTLPVVKRFMKGIFESRPSLPRYSGIWDVSIVFDYVESLGEVELSSLYELTIRLTGLLALLTSQRRQTLHCLDISASSMIEKGNELTFVVGKKVKQTRPGCHQAPLVLKSFPNNPKLCVVRHVKQYLLITKSLRGDTTSLFICTTKPHKAASKDTISRWIRTLLQRAGVPAIFSAHSTRAAASSAAASVNVPIDVILQNAGWQSQTTFATYYNKDIVSHDVNFCEHLQNRT